MEVDNNQNVNNGVNDNNVNNDDVNKNNDVNNNDDDVNNPQQIIFTEEQREQIKQLINEMKNKNNDDDVNKNNDDNDTNDNNNVDEGSKKKELTELEQLKQELQNLKQERTNLQKENLKIKKDLKINTILNKYNFGSDYVKKAVEKDLLTMNFEKDEDLTKYIEDLKDKEPKLFNNFNYGSRFSQGDKHFDKSFKNMSFQEMTELYKNNPDRYYQMKKNRH